MVKECRVCLNNTANPTISINKNGLCRVCELYKCNFNRRNLKKELAFLRSFIGSGKGKYDAMVGVSGGKDSTATLYTIKQMGFTPLAFTLDVGYYPKHIVKRAGQVARALGVDFVAINIKSQIKKQDLISYEKTAVLFDKKISEELKREFFQSYTEEKEHYSVKSKGSHSFVRTCRLCRHTVVPAYYREAVRRGVKVVVLGINEWAGLSQSKTSNRFIISGIRKLQPSAKQPPVYVVHLPFILQRKITDVRRILGILDWKKPPGEELIETNANSCLFARAAESKAKKLLGFHPDSTRLSREVTVGFITKDQARRALAKVHRSKYSVRQVLERAGIISK